MIKRLAVLLLTIPMVLASTVGAEDYWTKANSGIQTGIGAAESTEVELGTLELYLEQGWSSEFAELKGAVEEYISPYANEIDLMLKLGLMENLSENTFGEREKLIYSDYAKSMKAIVNYTKVESIIFSEVKNIVKCEDAVNDIIDILGYRKVYTDRTYSQIAENIGLLEGLYLVDDEPITREQFAKLVANALVTDRVVATDAMDGVVLYQISEGNTILAQMDITEIDGFVNADEYTNLLNIEKTYQNYIQINSKEYAIGVANARDMLGRYVKAYIKTDEDGAGTVIKIDVNAKRDNYLKLGSKELNSVGRTEIEYFEDDEATKRAKISSEANVIYNGKLIGMASNVPTTHYNENVSEIILCDKNYDDVFDFVIVWDYDNYVADVVTSNKISYMDNKGIISFANSSKRYVIKKDNEIISCGDIARYNILSVAVSDDDELYTVMVGDKKITGVCSAKTGTDEIVLENGDSYSVADSTVFNGIKIGKNYAYYLSFNGEVAYAAEASVDSMTNTGTGKNYGYLRDCGYDSFPEVVGMFRIFQLSNNQWVSLLSTEKIKYNKNGIESRCDVEDVVNELKGSPQLVVFETNEKGQLTGITTAVDNSQNGKLNNDQFVFNAKIEGDVRTYYGGYFGGIYHKGKCIVLRVPDDKEKEEFYGVENMASDGYIEGPIEIYDVSEALVLNGVIIRQSEGGAGVSGVAGTIRMIVKDKQEVAIDDEVAWKLTSIDNKEYYIKQSAGDIGIKSIVTGSSYNITNGSDIDIGDVVIAEADDLGYISAFRVDVRLKDLKSGSYFSYAGGDGLPPSLSYDYGVVKGNPSEGIIILNTGNNPNDDNYEKGNIPRVASGTVCRYNTSTNRFEILDSKNEIMPGEKLFTMAVYYYGSVMSVIIE